MKMEFVKLSEQFYNLFLFFLNIENLTTFTYSDKDFYFKFSKYFPTTCKQFKNIIITEFKFTKHLLKIEFTVYLDLSSQKKHIYELSVDEPFGISEKYMCSTIWEFFRRIDFILFNPNFTNLDFVKEIIHKLTIVELEII